MESNALCVKVIVTVHGTTYNSRVLDVDEITLPLVYVTGVGVTYPYFLQLGLYVAQNFVFAPFSAASVDLLGVSSARLVVVARNTVLQF